MTNSAHLKDDNGRYEKLPVCPVCNKKVHIEENDTNMDNWCFDHNGDFAHEDCLPEDDRC